MNTHNLSFDRNEIIQEIEKYFTHWVVELADGRKVYQDDYRSKNSLSSWERLKKYINSTNNKIAKMYLRFRSHYISIEENTGGYFFCKAARGYYGSNTTYEFFLVGTVEGDKVYIKKYQVPELIVVETEVRDLSKCLDCVILNGR